MCSGSNRREIIYSGSVVIHGVGGAPAAAIVVSRTGKESGDSQQLGITIGAVDDVINAKDLIDQDAVLLIENEFVQGTANC
jgi:hypothetical protein